MKPIPLVCFAALAAFLPAASACINISGTSMDGKKGGVAEDVFFYSRKELTDSSRARKSREERLPDLEKKMAGSPALRDRSDYGGILAYQGQFERAREVLEAAEALAPGDYAVASNLGTVYELLGDNAKAVEWIRKGMERNPKSHLGTEWLHIRIIEAKQALAADPKWLESHTVLEADYGTTPRPALQAEDVRTENRRLLVAAGHQLRERLQFVKAPDPLVGDLLFDLGNALAVAGTVEMALGVYELAQEYHAPRAALLAQRIEYMRRVIAKGGAKKPARQ